MAKKRMTADTTPFEVREALFDFGRSAIVATAYSDRKGDEIMTIRLPVKIHANQESILYEKEQDGEERRNDVKIYTPQTLLFAEDLTLKEFLQQKFDEDAECRNILVYQTFGRYYFQKNFNLKQNFSAEVIAWDEDRLVRGLNNQKTVNPKAYDAFASVKQSFEWYGVLSVLIGAKVKESIELESMFDKKSDHDIQKLSVDIKNRIFSAVASKTIAIDEDIDVIENLFGAESFKAIKEITSSKLPLTSFVSAVEEGRLTPDEHVMTVFNSIKNNSGIVLDLNAKIDESNLDLIEKASVSGGFDIRLLPNPDNMQLVGKRSFIQYGKNNNDMLNAINPLGLLHSDAGHFVRYGTPLHYYIRNVSSISHFDLKSSEAMLQHDAVKNAFTIIEKNSSPYRGKYSSLTIEADEFDINICYDGNSYRITDAKVSLTSLPSAYLDHKHVRELCASMANMHFEKINHLKVKQSYLDFFDKPIQNNIRAINASAGFESKFLNSRFKDFYEALYVSNIDPTLKIFPNIVDIANPSLLSLKDIVNDAVILPVYLASDMGSVIEDAARINKLPIKKMMRSRLSLSNPASTAPLPEERDDIVNINGKLGILGFKYLPLVIELKNDRDKEIFIDVLAKTIFNAKAADNTVTLDEIKKEVIGGYRDILTHANQMILKKQQTLIDNNFVQEERFALVDRFYNELLILNVPVFNFYDQLKEEGILKFEDYINGLSLTAKEINILYSAARTFNKQALAGYEEQYQILYPQIKAEILKLFSSQDFKGDLSVLIRANKDALISYIKSSELTSLAEAIIKPTVKIDEVASRIVANDSYEISNKETIEKGINEYIRKRVNGREHFFIDENDTSERNTFFKIFGSYKFAADLYATFEAYAMERKAVYEASYKMLQSYMFEVECDLREGMAADPVELLQVKNAAFNVFLKNIMGLRTHQFMETKGFLGLWLQGKKTTTFWHGRCVPAKHGR
jgi:hypothetical protein